MAVLPTPFNAHAVEPINPLQQLPVSDATGHIVMITASEFKASKNNPEHNGYLELTLSVIDGPHKGASGAYRLNLFNENQETVAIANRQLSALCHVCNQMMVSDSAQLHNIPFRAIVGLQKKQKPEDPDYTQVNGVLDIHGNKPGSAGAPPAPVPQQPASAAPAFAQPSAPSFAQPQQPSAPAFAQPAAPVQANPGPAAGAPPWAR